MNIAILAVASLGLVCAASSLVIMARTAKKLDNAGTKLKADVDAFKAKTDRNLRRVKAALGEMEL